MPLSSPTDAHPETTDVKPHTNAQAIALIERDVADHDTLTLSPSAFEAFVAECDSPAPPNPALCALMARR